MIAFLCHFYGGTSFREWMDTPIRTFFAMYREGIKMEARHYAEMADISLISNNMPVDYWASVRGRYEKIIDPEIINRPDRPSGFVVEADSDEANQLMRNLGQKLKRNAGYG
jgi:hypothetical protein